MATILLVAPCEAAPLFSDVEPSDSEEYVIRQWTTADGLPVNYVGGIVQGDEGYLWLRGGGGLVRFDGREFKVFTRNDLPGWQTSYVDALYKDREGALWLVSRRGTLTRYHEGQFYTYDWTAPNPKQLQFYEGSNDELWVSSGAQIVRIAGKATTAYPINGEWHGKKFKGFHEDGQGRLWVFATDRLLRKAGKRFVIADTTRVFRQIVKRNAGGVWAATSGGLFRFEEGRFTASSPGLAPSDRVSEMHEDDRGRLWVGTYDGRLICIDGSEETVYAAEDGLPRGPISTVYEQKNGRLWVKVGQHGLVYLAGGQFKKVGLDEYQSPPSVSEISEGPEGNLWVGMGSGLFRLSPRSIQGYTRADGLPGDLIFPILQDDEGAVWMGTHSGGLHRLTNGDPDGPKTTLTTADGLPDNNIRALHLSQNGDLWVGASGQVARIRDGTVRETQTVGNRGNMVRALYEDDRGRLWVGGEALFLLDENSVRRHGPPLLRHGNATIRAIHEDQSGTIWVTTKKGLFRKKEGDWRRFTTQDGLPSNFLLSVHEEPDGTLWFTTHGAGLVRYEEEGNFFTYTVADGLYSNAIWQILEDDRGHFWMSSNTGIFRVRKRALERFRTGTIDRVSSRVFTVADGMPSSECAHTQPAGWKTRDGRLWFPTIKGAAIVDPGQVPSIGQPPPVRLQRVRANGRRLNGRQTHVLEPGRNNLAFHYAALSFSAPERSRYRYKLVGYDEAWQQAGARRAAVYTNLPPGQYRFRVQARSGNGGWTEEGASFAFTLQPQFWQTAWFYLLCVAGIVGLFYAAHWIRLRRVREQELERKVEERTEALWEEKEKSEQQAKRLQALDEARSRLFTDLSHELRTPLTMISTPLHTVLTDANGALPEDARELLEAAHRNAERMEDLVDQLTVLSRLETGRLSLEPRPGDLVTLARETTRSFEPMAERKDVELRFRTDLEQLPHVFDPEKLRSVLGNLIENALHYMPEGGKVLVRVERSDEETASLRVSDTGPGIPEDERSHLFDRFYQGGNAQRHRTDGSGLGLALANELAELHGGTIEVESELEMGSTFTVVLPLREPEEGWEQSEGEPGDGEEGQTKHRSVGQSGTEDGTERRVERDASAENEQASPAESSLTILIVEDNPDVRTYLRNRLSTGYEIETAVGGAEALDKARSTSPDLVLSDVMMPGVDGVELCRRLKGDEELRDVPVILLTAKVGEEAHVEGLGAGADAYVEKPFSMETLRARIQRLIESREALRDQYRAEVVMKPSGVSVTPEEEEFYEEARAVVEAHIDESRFTVEQFAGELSVSRSTLRRRLKGATGQAPAEFVRHLRLERAAQFLRKDPDLRVYQVADAVGYESPDYFARIFREHFGVSPSGYRAGE